MLISTKEYIYGTSTYIVYEDGRVFSINKNRFLRVHNNGKGYFTVNLWSGNSTSKFYIHRLVAICFLDNPRKLREVNHKDTNKANNHISNLEWCSKEENMAHALREGCFKIITDKAKENQRMWIGQKFGKRTVIEVLDEKSKKGNYKVLVKCDCGNILKMYYNDLAKNKNTCCIKCKYSEEPKC